MSGRVRWIAAGIVCTYGGDARGIWRGQPAGEVLRRPNAMETGGRYPRMIIGAPIDTGQIHGKGDPKADIHVREYPEGCSGVAEYPRARSPGGCRQDEPGNSWILDGHIYRIGRDTCKGRRPQCGTCCLRDECLYRRRHPGGRTR